MMNYNSESTPELPMRWHKFLAYFALWLGFLHYLLQADTFINGKQYGSETQRDAVYQLFGGMKTIDALIGIAYAAVAFLSFYTAVQLIKFKRNAPQKLTILYIISATIHVLYILLTASATQLPSSELLDITVYSAIIVCAAGIFICKAYYDKRKHLFVN